MSNTDHNSPGNWLMRRRVLASIGAHALLFAFGLFVAFALRYDFRFREPWLVHEYLTYLPLTLLVKLVVFGVMGLYRDSWRYVGLRDLFSIIKASHISIFLCVVFYFIIVYFLSQQTWTYLLGEKGYWVPSAVFLLDWVLTIAVVSTARVGFRFYHEELRPLSAVTQHRLLIIGAGDVGDTILRDIIRTSEDRYLVVGFLDVSEAKQGGRIRGIEVLGKPDDIRRICEQHNVDEVLLADPAMSQRDIRKLIETCHGLNLRFHTVPAVTDVIEGRVQVSQIRPVDIEDLLGREPVQLDSEAIGRYIEGKVIMVTGAGGSIGSEMCRQIARFKPKRLLLVERMENALFEIDRSLAREFPELARKPLVADIADKNRIRQILLTEHPTAIFHAAAHKHVPMMEWNPGEAIKNNVVGTRNLADAASEAGVAKFVMISTDKAVNPTSVMGCTKRVAEMYVQQLGSHGGSRTEFVTVRFGNVLGSSGSVVPIFKEQIARGGPVTVTHREMTRYFMTIPEAAQLVLQAGAMGVGGEIFLLDMGEPVKIYDLAVDLITLSGLRPGVDIDIQITGMRPGEKLFEELSIDGEDASRTAHPKIGIIKKRPEDFDRVCEGIERLVSIADTATPEEIRAELQKVVPEYTPSVPNQQPAPVLASA
ncbi:MAG TPA: nucleoside-diphosphate sugar epimerase/dehydratase [Phycisphaerae bacterium]|nr:nucleoside-diphosphate sugar epimerase/dehydratase [Phycisphaerae bacterium]HOJ56003.1 nucleoside-diphosphate sugar epimerase/dehydratase [Phycisphaerae bacterium]HOL25524.1 nucleoside-diphosphate sugar epimerase/dehydratase [Phycisphaerae bacterium]HPP22283.1 nucleoside-diphosphate sugar epimerase/dehydratase [Phycisphaerae bacterium]HQA45660.1 nucleoside-diphosphate sugar epimerase/dehydratase [Phycisphaerae bacterium]